MLVHLRRSAVFMLMAVVSGYVAYATNSTLPETLEPQFWFGLATGLTATAVMHLVMPLFD